MSENPESFFREVDEGVRRDRMIAIVRRYGPPAALILGLVLAGIFAWRFYDAQREAGLRDQAEIYNAALAAAGLATDSITSPDDQTDEKTPVDPQVAVAALAEAAGRLEGGYRHLAQMQQAGVLVRAGQFAEAAGLYDAVAAGTADAQLHAFASFLAASAALEAEGPDGAIARLEPLAAPGAPLRFSALELLAVANLRAGDREAALARLASITEDPEAPAELRRRVDEMLAALGDDAP